MTDLDALRGTLEKRRQELAEIKAKRASLEEEVSYSVDERALKNAIASVEEEITQEKVFLESQENIVVSMVEAVEAEEKERAEQEALLKKIEEEAKAAAKQAAEEKKKAEEEAKAAAKQAEEEAKKNNSDGQKN